MRKIFVPAPTSDTDIIARNVPIIFSMVRSSMDYNIVSDEVIDAFYEAVDACAIAGEPMYTPEFYEAFIDACETYAPGEIIQEVGRTRADVERDICPVCGKDRHPDTYYTMQCGCWDSTVETYRAIAPHVPEGVDFAEFVREVFDIGRTAGQAETGEY